MINSVRPLPPDDKGKTFRASEFEEKHKKIEKAREVDPEEKRKKFRRHFEKESEAKSTEEKKPSPYETQFYDKDTFKTGKEEVKELSEEIEQKGMQAEGQSSEKKEAESFHGKEEKTAEDNKLHDKQEPYPPKHPLESKEAKATTYLPPKPEERIEQKQLEQEKKQGIEKKVESPEIKEELEEKKQEPIENKTPLPSLPIEMSAEMVQRSSEITNSVKVFLDPQIAPLFEQMVGRMVIMSAKEGIMQTQIDLTSSNFENSVFFGSSIVLEKYATAPDSFNIRLTGSPEAVTIFNANMESLMEAFQKSNLNFRIGRVEAAYQTSRPLFRRKGSASGGNLSDQDLGKMP